MTTGRINQVADDDDTHRREGGVERDGQVEPPMDEPPSAPPHTSPLPLHSTTHMHTHHPHPHSLQRHPITASTVIPSIHTFESRHRHHPREEERSAIHPVQHIHPMNTHQQQTAGNNTDSLPLPPPTPCEMGRRKKKRASEEREGRGEMGAGRE